MKLPDLPLIGRRAELDRLAAILAEVAAGTGRTVFVVGEGGIGKTRLVAAAAEAAAQQGWRVLVGHAFPVETGIPYALLADAVAPLTRELGAEELAGLTRGTSAELALLHPGFQTAASPPPRGESAELKTRLFWSFAQLLEQLGRRAPVLLWLENIQWADAASLELFHFAARQLAGARVLLLCTYNDAERSGNLPLQLAARSLVGLGAERLRLGPLTTADTTELLRSVFGAGAPVEVFSERLRERTHGNPLFVEETLKALVETGALHLRDGVWLGWEMETVRIPQSVRELFLMRLAQLSPAARGVAERIAVFGAEPDHEELRAVAGLAEAELLAAVDELRTAGIIRETAAGAEVRYALFHPGLRQTVYDEVGARRARLWHGATAEALEALHGPHVEQQAELLAYHFLNGPEDTRSTRAVHYLATAGERALARHANPQAAAFLRAAVAETERAGHTPDVALLRALARAEQRLGRYTEALAAWEQVLAHLGARIAHGPAARARLEAGRVCQWSGRHARALEHFGLGLEAAHRAGDTALHVRLQLARAVCLQQMGQAAAVREETQRVLPLAEHLGDAGLLARVHRVLLVLFAWTGPFERAREHGEQAVALATAAGEPAVACSAHWTLGMLLGLTGDSAAAARHTAAARELAEQIGSPLLGLWSTEMAVELASATGDWAVGLARGENAIELCRRLNQQPLLARLLVWTGLIRLGLGQWERAHAMFAEAWDLAGCGAAGAAAPDVHTAVPAHTGLAAYHLATGNYAEARRVGEAGLAVADRSGYVIWSVHRLIPVVAESYLWMADLQGAQQLGRRLRDAAEQMGHRLARAWADACDGVVAQLQNDHARAADLLRRGVEELEAVPVVLDAARLRRQLALVLAETGDRDAAVRELRRAHDAFARLGAERELTATRERIRALGSRPPAPAAAGAGALTARELDVVRGVVARKSNKAIGRELGISPRTVGTHLANVYQKLEVTSRGELADFAREQRLLADR